MLATKVNICTRFKAIDQANLNGYQYMRIRDSPVFVGQGQGFSKIYIINSIENDVNLIVFIPEAPN